MDKKSSFLRMLWIPGTRKTHPKGHYGPTNKQISYTAKPKKSEVWSLGGSKIQKDLLQAESNTILLDGPSNSGLVSAASVVTTVGAVAAIAANGRTNTDASSVTEISENSICSESTTSNETINSSSKASLSTVSPNSTVSAITLLSPTLSKLDERVESTLDKKLSSTSELTKMPAKNHSPTPAIVTTTTTAEIINVDHYVLENNSKDPLHINEFGVFSMPSTPKTFLNGCLNGNSTDNGVSITETIEQINSSNSTTNELFKSPICVQKITSIQKKIQIQNENQQCNHHHHSHQQQKAHHQQEQEQEQQQQQQQHQQKQQYHNHHYSNNNHSPRTPNNSDQGDVNSIESIDDDDNTSISTKIYSSSTLPQQEKHRPEKQQQQQQDQPQMKQEQKEQKEQQEQQEQQNIKADHIILAKSKKKHKKRNGCIKDLDQLDGVPPKSNITEANKDDDEKIVKCLYYTLMCCDCTIS